jgi:hypothetical protein
MPLQRFTRRTGRGARVSATASRRLAAGDLAYVRPRSMRASSGGCRRLVGHRLPSTSTTLAGDRSSCVLFGDALRFVRSPTFVILRSRPSRTPLLGFIDSPSPATAAASTPGRRAPCDACLPSDRTCQVRSRSVLAVPPGFNGFLRSDARLRLLPCGRPGSSQVCCTLQPAVGFATFPARRSLAASSTSRSPRSEDRGHAFPCGVDPSKRSPPR